MSTTPGAPETEALAEAWGQHRIWTQEDGQFSNCSCGGWGWNGDVSSAIPQFVTHRSQAVADSLASDLLATRDAAQRAAGAEAALREAADEMWRIFLRLPHTPSPLGDYVQRKVMEFRERADRIGGAS